MITTGIAYENIEAFSREETHPLRNVRGYAGQIDLVDGILQLW